MILAATLALAGLANPEYVTCKLAKRITVNGTMICLYVHANKGTTVHYPTHKWSECVSTFQCKYNPKSKGRTLKDTMDALKEQFE
tara:strand:- start:42 stop:296 length:255 start_codon:yes stop_codon:yes gene_type:complete